MANIGNFEWKTTLTWLKKLINFNTIDKLNKLYKITEIEKLIIRLGLSTVKYHFCKRNILSGYSTPKFDYTFLDTPLKKFPRYTISTAQFFPNFLKSVILKT